MSKTFAVYKQDEQGVYRVGLWTYRGKGVSMRILSEAFHKQCPHAHETGKLYLAKRWRISGQWVDGERLEMEKPQEAAQ